MVVVVPSTIVLVILGVNLQCTVLFVFVGRILLLPVLYMRVKNNKIALCVTI